MERIGFGHYRLPLPYISFPDKPARFVDIQRCFQEVSITKEFQNHAVGFDCWCAWFCDQLDAFAERSHMHRMPGPLHFYKVPPELLSDYQLEQCAASCYDVFRVDGWYHSDPTPLFI